MFLDGFPAFLDELEDCTARLTIRVLATVSEKMFEAFCGNRFQHQTHTRVMIRHMLNDKTNATGYAEMKIINITYM